jgi:hypothetical protein
VELPLVRGQDVDRDLDWALIACPCDVEDDKYVLLVGELEEVGFLRGRRA